MTANSTVGGIDRLQLLTVKEAAEILREDPKTTHRKLQRGVYPWVNIAGPGQRVKIRIRKAELDAFLDDPERYHPMQELKPRRRTAA